MNRTLTTERLYSLGDFKNIKFGDIIADIPQEVMFNPELIAQLRYLQLVEMETMLNKYLQLKANFTGKSTEEILKYLEENQITILHSIKQLLNGNIKGE